MTDTSLQQHRAVLTAFLDQGAASLPQNVRDAIQALLGSTSPAADCGTAGATCEACPEALPAPLKTEWRVGEYWLSASPGTQVFVLSVGDDISKHGKHKDFIRWVGHSGMPEIPADKVLIDRMPTPGLLMSMAIRLDHGLACPGYYDQPFFQALGINKGITHARRLEVALSDMQKLHEEVSGRGFYAASRDGFYRERMDGASPASDTPAGARPNPLQTLSVAVGLLTDYERHIATLPSDRLELHPYLPTVEATRRDLELLIPQIGSALLPGSAAQ